MAGRVKENLPGGSLKYQLVYVRILKIYEILCLDVVTVFIYIHSIPSDLKKLTGVYIWNKRKDCCL